MRLLGPLALCLCLSACGDDELPAETPGQAFVDAYEIAYGAGDAHVFFALHTKGSQRHLVTQGMQKGYERTVLAWFNEFRKALDARAPSPLGGPYARERREGDKLICVIGEAGGTRERELTLVQEDGTWRLDLLDTYMPFSAPNR